MAHDQVTTLRADGRWNGNVTSRPLPAGALDGLSAEERRTLSDAWLARASTERRVGLSFGVVHEALLKLDAPKTLCDLADRAIDDEMRHGELCRMVASHYAGKEVDLLPDLPFSYPPHEAASDALRPLLHVVGQCCFNETIASSFLETSVDAATDPLAKAALRELLSDEIDHGRIGWATLAAVPAPLRGQLQAWLLPLARGNLKMWRDASRPYPDSPAFEAHGAPGAARVEQALLTAFVGLIIPGMQALGFDVAPIQAWVSRGAPTNDDPSLYVAS